MPISSLADARSGSPVVLAGDECDEGASDHGRLWVQSDFFLRHFGIAVSPAPTFQAFAAHTGTPNAPESPQVTVRPCPLLIGFANPT